MPDFSIQPADLRATASDLTDVSARMKDVMSRLATNLAAEGAPWGDDDSGRKFRGGDSNNGYEAQRDWVHGSVDAKTMLLDQYAEGLRTGADTLEQTDDL
jgi:uncharacterized protein YukE